MNPRVGDVVLPRYRSNRTGNESICAIGSLTDREREVLAWVGRGRTSRQIAEQLSVSSRTVDKHKEHIMGKLRVHTSTGLAALAVRHGLA